MNINIFVYRYVKVKILGVLSRFLKGGILCMFNYIATDSFMYIYIYIYVCAYFFLDMYRYRAQGLKYTFLQGGMDVYM